MFYLLSAVFFFLYFFFMFLFFLVFLWGGILFDFCLFSFWGLDFTFSFVFDYVSLGFFSCVSFISGVVFLYSGYYMLGTEDFRRFLYLVFFFVLSMMLLVFSGNFFLVMVGWDGLGLVSFCLVIFYPNSMSLESGLVTVFSNRLGDAFFLVSFYFFLVSGGFFFDSFFSSFSSCFLFFVFFGAITKSAQIPFSAWLPAAMAAPTPVSSLVHSSTLVTAGVYILVRFNYMFSFFSFLSLKALFICTMLVAGACAALEKDFKKIVAMSTLSQLGMMMFILSVGCWLLTYLHMIIHAFFKSMLFLSTGSVMHSYSGLQDSRFYGSYSFGPSSFLFFFVSCLCLMGFPFFIGFYSKDFIISSASFGSGLFFYYLFVVGCFFTVFYSFRLLRECYGHFFKYNSLISFSEDSNFFLPVSLLFFKCWSLGGLFYWFFLSCFSFSMTLLDLSVGLLLIFGVFFFYRFLVFSRLFSFYLFSIIFFRWLTSGPSSSFFMKFKYLGFESGWMEFLGGCGVYGVLSRSNFYFSFFSKVSLGILIFIFFFVVFYFLFYP